MSSQTNKILGNTNLLNKSEIDRYLSGKLNKEEKYAIEQKLSNDSFAADAMEGFASNPEALEGFKQLENKFKNKYLNRPKSLGITTIGLIFTSLTAIIAIIYSINLKQKNTGLLASKENKKQEVFVSNTETSKDDLYNNKEEVKEIDEAELIQEPNLLTYEKTLENMPVTVEDAQPTKKEDYKEYSLIEPEVNDQPIIENINLVEQSNVKLKYFFDLKVVDYSEFYSTPISQLNFSNNGTPANLANKESSNPLEQDVVVKYIPYENYLKQSLKKFTKGEYKGALKNFRQILAHYPEDVNAHLYGGLCYYNLGKFSKAINYFTLVETDHITSFNQEADWFKALSLVKNKKETEAKALLLQIIEKGGFYSEQAKDLLLEID